MKKHHTLPSLVQSVKENNQTALQMVSSTLGATKKYEAPRPEAGASRQCSIILYCAP